MAYHKVQIGDLRLHYLLIGSGKSAKGYYEIQEWQFVYKSESWQRLSGSIIYPEKNKQLAENELKRLNLERGK